MDRFTSILVLLLVLLGGYLLLDGPVRTTPGEAEYLFFYLPTCPHCHEQMEFHQELKKEFVDLEITSYDVSTPSGQNAYLHYVGQDIRTPVTIIGNTTITGFDSAQTTGKQIRSVLAGEVVEDEPEQRTFFGRDASSFSLPALAVVLGFLDGFNPCAMWMLLYLLSLVATVRSRSRRWLIVGTFLAASAVLYFLFMTAWLNLFMIVGVLRPVRMAIALFAVSFGTLALRDWVHGDASCKIDPARKKKYEKAKSIVSRPLSFAVVAGIIALAFAVNSVEFLCSAGIPAVFTGVLASSGASALSQYMLIALYVLLYMIDDLIVFVLAMLAIDTYFSEKYMRHANLFSGILLILLGAVMLFAPGLLF